MRRGVLVVAAVLLAGCTRELPAPVRPGAVAPRIEVAPGPLAPENGRVVLDTTGGPSRVYLEAATAEMHRSVPVHAYEYNGGSITNIRTEIEHISSYGTALVPLCKTPCVADLPRGPHTLHFEADGQPSPSAEEREQATVTFGAAPIVHRRTLGHHPTMSALLEHGILSGAWIFSGATFTTIGGGLTFFSDDAPSQRAGATMLVAGVVGLVTGIVYGFVAAPREQDGVATEFRAP